MTKEHFEEIINNCVSYFWEIWNNEPLDDIEDNFKRLGFTKEDLDYFEITSEIEYLTSEIEYLNGEES